MPVRYPDCPQPSPPPFDGVELRVHAHRRPPGITAAERELVIVFLIRYVVWCAKLRQVERLQNAMGLLVEVASQRARPSNAECG